MNKRSYRTEVEMLVRRLGMTPTYRGYRYLVEGVCLALEEPDRLQYVTKGIYLEVALVRQCTAGSVERGIRTMIETVWNREPGLFREVIGYPFTDRPSVSELIGSITGYVSLKKNIG